MIFLSGGSDRKDNIFPLDLAGREGQDKNSLEDLVRHMRMVRDSIPVNQKLRRELRERLFPGQEPAIERAPAAFPGKAAPWRKPGLWMWAGGSFVVLLLLAAAIYNLRGPAEKVLSAGPSSDMSRFWAEQTPLSPAVSPSGELVVVERGGALLLLDRQGSRFATVRPPAGQRYLSPAWSPDGGKLALVREKSDGSQVLSLEIPSGAGPGDIQAAIQRGAEQSPVLVGRPPGSSYSGLSWSPDGSTLACSLKENGQRRIILISGNQEVALGEGTGPAWSPDGSWLVVERGGPEVSTLWLVKKDGGESRLLGPGKFPVWNKNGYLLFVKTVIREKILSFLPDGSPQFTVQTKTGEIRWLYTGRGEEIEKKLLSSPDKGLARAGLIMAPESPAGPEELQWLRNLELSGVREPRTLYQDRANEYEGMSPGDGMSLYLSRRDGRTGTVFFTRIGLVENAAKREGSVN